MTLSECLFYLGFLFAACMLAGICKKDGGGVKSVSLAEIIAKRLSPFPLKCRIVNLIKFYDGDSIYVAIDNIFFMFVFAGKIGLRMNRIDTAEMHGKTQSECELAVWQRDFGNALYDSATEKYVILICPDKYYGRVVAELHLKIKGQWFNYSDCMLKHGKAKKYDGGTKSKW